jgi:predicted permease
VSSTFFDTLGATPMLGRGFRPEDDTHRAPSVVVLAHGAWVRLFAADPGVIGRRIQLDGQATEVIGVMPAAFDFPRGADLWAPVLPILSGPGDAPNLNVLNGVGLLYVVGRLRPDLDARRAAPELNEMSRRLAAAVPSATRPSDVAVVKPFTDYVFGPVRPALWALSAAVVVLLLVACANVSGLMLTRVSLRRREHGVRLALGATGGGLGRLWTVEVLLLTAIGGAIGYAASYGLVRAIVALAPDDVPGLRDVAIDTPVTVFTVVVVLVAALLAGLFPIRQARASRIVDLLDDGGRATAARRSLRTRSVLLVAQIALAVVLLVTCGLIVKSFVNLRRVNLGFSPANVLTLTVQPRSINEPPNQWFDRLLTRVAALRGVEASGAIYLRPLVLGPIGQGVAVRLDGEPVPRPGQPRHPMLNHQIATVGYFETMNIRLIRGRVFSREDTAASDRVVIVGETTARRLWPGVDPIGKRLSMSGFTPGKPGPAWRTVVGVVADVRYRGLEEVLLDIYDPALQVGRPANQLVVRTAANPLALAGAIQAEARAMDAQAIVDDVTTMDAVVARATAPWRLTTWMFVLFAGVAFALAATGLFSLVALEVANRRREFAVRLALGATRGEILQTVVARAAWRAAVGLIAGLLVSVALTRGVRSLLFEVEVADLTTYLSVVALVVAVVLTAAGIPARRATRVDPAAALRGE